MWTYLPKDIARARKSSVDTNLYTPFYRLRDLQSPYISKVTF